ncbi:MurR/RpiR family transcriptional regulator, partial [Dietzia maris]|uniref:MurR/RpiR family transcriptional regulator n=1 Tax=Dietzia maris TaxID=37915 RepID=UPI00344D43E9
MASTEDNRLEYSGVLDRIRSILPSLIPSEQRVATEVVENPENVLDLPAAAMAARTGTSAATVSRASKNLGFSGYQHLRMLIARELGARSSGGSVADEPGDRGIVRSSFSKAADALSIAVDSIDFEAFNRAADLIAGAGRVLIVANGGSAPLAHAVTIQFLASERVAEAPADAVTLNFVWRDFAASLGGSGEAGGEGGAAESVS